MSHGTYFADAVLGELLTDEPGAPTKRGKSEVSRHSNCFGGVGAIFDKSRGRSPVSHASELDLVACPILGFDVLDPRRSDIFRGLQVFMLPSFKVEVGVIQRRRRVLCDGILQCFDV